MKKFFTLIALLCCCICRGQNYDKIWAFGDSAGINFNTSPPVGITTAIDGYEGTASVSDNNGQLLFYTEGRTVWTRNHQPMPNGTGIMAGNPSTTTTTQQAAIAGVPGYDYLYYVFSLDDGPQTILSYSLVNMNLNTGLGDVVTSQKGIRLDSVFAEKMLLVAGNNCDIWLIVRSPVPAPGCYKSFRITSTGITTTPVISPVGYLPVTDYQYGYLVASPDRRHIAAAVRGAELYDFNATTGVLSNPRLLPGPPSNGFYYGLCFSPDNSKLYGANVGPGIDQFDLGQATTAAIIASKTNITTEYARAMRLAPNGKIYIPGELTTTMKSIESPNLAGNACQYLSNALQLAPGTQNIIGLPNYNVILQRDSVSNRRVRYLCDGSVQLSPINTGIDYLWENGSTNPVRDITVPGRYVISYHFICSYYSDTFIVLPKPAFPRIGLVQGNCSGQQNGKIVLEQSGGDTTTYRYTWYDALGNVLRQSVSNAGDQLTPLLQGSYGVKVSTADSCDTLLTVIVPELPAPTAQMEAGEKFCAGEPVHFTNKTSGLAQQFHWDFGDGSASDLVHPDHIYLQPGTYAVTMIAGNADCSDTAYTQLTIHDFDLSLAASTPVVDFKGRFILQTAATEQYTITAWMPQQLFTDQQAYQQSLQGDSTRRYMVTGYSVANQCIDTASVEVVVEPVFRFPTAFSPNGDGLNDYFQPIIWGSHSGVKRFVVYDRWGKKVWMAMGQEALTGWGGTYNNGAKANTGTYYWYLELAFPLKGETTFKGDVTLMK